jgi:tRNA A-37 threonylcarbamoyl transferase component Bud32
MLKPGGVAPLELDSCSDAVHPLQRHLSSTQPYLEFDTQPEASSSSQTWPVALLRSLTPGLVPHVEIYKEMQQVIIGRQLSLQLKPENMRVTVNDKRVSSEHCRIWRVDAPTPESAHTFLLQDSSSNGTFLNGERIEKGRPYPLRSGDEFSLVVNSCVRKHMGCRSHICCAYVFRVLGVERSCVLKDAGSIVEEKYVLSDKVLGSGAFSQVLLCNEKSSPHRHMALKVVDKKKFAQFRRLRHTELTVDSERKVMERMEHPNIVKLHETFDTPSCFYLVMEYVAGGDLLERILDHGIYAQPVTRRLFADVLKGIRCMHENGIVHRDIKPENILLTTVGIDAVAKIADMGIAKHLDSEFGSPPHVQKATVCGTMNYFAPEMVHAASGGLSSYGKAVDMWAAGVVLYIMLCGFPPFDEENLYEQIASGRYGFEADQWVNVSSLAKDMVQKLMMVDAQKRLAIAEAFEHPWMEEGYHPMKRRRTNDGYVASGGLESTDDTHARKIATPIISIE